MSRSFTIHIYQLVGIRSKGNFMKTQNLFVLTLGAVLVLGLGLALAPIQYGATVHSSLTTSHTKIDKGGVVETTSHSLAAKLFTLGGGGYGVVSADNAGLVTVTSSKGGNGIFTLIGSEGHLIGGAAANTVQATGAGAGMSGQVTWFQDTPE